MNEEIIRNRHKVLAFVALWHVQQKRKYTGEPYLFHLQAVAEMADGKCPYGYEIGLCHDLLEDTICTEEELGRALLRFGYTVNEANLIVECVVELTDVWTPENSPELNRKARKTLEALRLHAISPTGQSVKYADLIDNTKSIVEHDPGFAKKYIQEKEAILEGMDQGNKILRRWCLKSLEDAKLKLSKDERSN